MRWKIPKMHNSLLMEKSDHTCHMAKAIPKSRNIITPWKIVQANTESIPPQWHAGFVCTKTIWYLAAKMTTPTSTASVSSSQTTIDPSFKHR
mmetsp:Transcript_33703/g.54272  ORF Transcript_33703/g.54272 Transcript_33703/m.54272 type:complete len:92 (-) Transcript_33703:389-664(-)